jgi:hypothetical protein
MQDEWIGKYNRENQTMPVLHLRESAQKMGLLREHRGTLLLTQRGRMLRSDPVALWWQLAEMMPLRSTDECEKQAGRFFCRSPWPQRSTTWMRPLPTCSALSAGCAVTARP